MPFSAIFRRIRSYKDQYLCIIRIVPSRSLDWCMTWGVSHKGFTKWHKTPVFIFKIWINPRKIQLVELVRMVSFLAFNSQKNEPTAAYARERSSNYSLFKLQPLLRFNLLFMSHKFESSFLIRWRYKVIDHLVIIWYSICNKSNLISIGKCWSHCDYEG